MNCLLQVGSAVLKYLLPEFAENGGSFDVTEMGKAIDDKVTSILEGDSLRFGTSFLSVNQPMIQKNSLLSNIL